MDIILYCFVTSLIWGATNILIKNSTKDITSVQSDSVFKRLLSDLIYLVLNWRYMLLFLINQSGSLLYFFLLQNGDLSLVVPLTNALTVIVTGICGALFGEEKANARLFFGTLIITIGITLCILDKVRYQTTVPV